VNLILTGCEFAGKTTLGDGICAWIAETMGSSRSFHDHFTMPSPEIRDADRDLFMRMSPDFRERFQRYQLDYHLHPSFYAANDHLLIGYHIEEAVYAPLYYGYGGDGAVPKRSRQARELERRIMDIAPDTILVLLKAAPETIRERMRRNPMPRDQRGRRPATVRPGDVEQVLDRFEQEVAATLIRAVIEIDNTELTPEQTLRAFVRGAQPHLSDRDLARIATYRALQESGHAAPPEVRQKKQALSPEDREAEDQVGSNA
jgi:hypothetical protein